MPGPIYRNITSELRDRICAFVSSGQPHNCIPLPTYLFLFSYPGTGAGPWRVVGESEVASSLIHIGYDGLYVLQTPLRIQLFGSQFPTGWVAS